MSELVEFEGEFYQGTPTRQLGLIAKLSGTRPPIVQADVASIALKIFDLDSATPTTDLYTGAAPVVASVIFNTLQLGPQWPEGDNGYNFDHTVITTAFAPKGEHSYRYEYTFTMSTAAEGPLVAVWIWKCKRVRG